MKAALAILAATALSGCASLAAPTATAAEFYLNLRIAGVDVDGKITKAEAPAYISAAVITFGDEIPPEYHGALALACDLSGDIASNYDAEAAAACASVGVIIGLEDE